jgi:hypothetical protein
VVPVDEGESLELRWSEDKMAEQKSLEEEGDSSISVSVPDVTSSTTGPTWASSLITGGDTHKEEDNHMRKREVEEWLRGRLRYQRLSWASGLVGDCGDGYHLRFVKGTLVVVIRDGRVIETQTLREVGEADKVKKGMRDGGGLASNFAFCPPLGSSTGQPASGDGRGGRESTDRREEQWMAGFGWAKLGGLYALVGPDGWLDKFLLGIMPGPVPDNTFLVVFGGGGQPRHSRTTGNRCG